MSKVPTHPLVREGEPYQKNRKYLKIISVKEKDLDKDL
jgi:hypothetical protein